MHKYKEIKHHMHEQEIQIVRDYEKRGLLEWKIISDLEPTNVINSKYGKF